MELITLNTLLARGGKISPRVFYLLMHPLVEQLIEHESTSDLSKDDINSHLTADDIAFSPTLDQVVVMRSSDDEGDNVRQWGNIMLAALERVGYHDKRLQALATRCACGEVTTLSELHLLLERRVNRSIYKFLLIIIAVGLSIMAIVWLL